MDWATGASSGSTTALRPAPPFSPGTVRSFGRIGGCWTCCPPGRARQMPGDSSLRAVFAHAQGACTFAKSVGFGSQTNVRSDASARVTLALASDGFQARPRERQGVFSFRSGAPPRRLWRASARIRRERNMEFAREARRAIRETDGWIGDRAGWEEGAGGTLCAPLGRAKSAQVLSRPHGAASARAPPRRPPLHSSEVVSGPRRRRGAPR